MANDCCVCLKIIYADLGIVQVWRRISLQETASFEGSWSFSLQKPAVATIRDFRWYVLFPAFHLCTTLRYPASEIPDLV
jgi:hypothetical protein